MARIYTSSQKQALQLRDEAVAAIPNLKPFFRGRIPNFDHYKRCNIDPDRALKIASYGYLYAKKHLNVDLFFTQALITGACLNATHSKISVILSSQYGKSFMCGTIALLLGFNGEEVSVAANDTPLTQKIMKEVFKVIPNASPDFKSHLTNPSDYFEKLQLSISKTKLGFIGGGVIEPITLGGSFTSPLKSNQAVGQSGNYIVDESALVPDTNYSETGRSEFGVRKDGRPFVSLEVSNPHSVNHFYRLMTADPIPDGTLIIWGDIRIAIEEGAYLIRDVSELAPVFEETKFFNLDSACIKYLLCDFGSTDDESFFDVSPIIDSSPIPDSYDYVLGLDSASRGADSIMGCIMQLPKADSERLRVVKLIDFKPTKWEDFESPKQIAKEVVAVSKKFNIKFIAMDLGGGEVLYDHIGTELMKESLSIGLRGVYFNESPSKWRIRKNHDLSDNSANAAELAVNKRAEMYLDLRHIMHDANISFTQEVADILASEFAATGPLNESSGGKIQMKDKVSYIKRRLGHSPDALDACVLALHASVLNSLKTFSLSDIDYSGLYKTGSD